MGFSVSDSSALPLQLQIEARVAGAQKLAYLPTSDPSLDFYYLNYRPSYRAGESTIDFWMLTPQGSKAPKTGPLELFDEFGRIRLAVLVPEGTEAPQTTANKNKPFLWKNWVVPKTLKANFDFSEKFRVVLRTSDTNNNMKKKVDKRLDMDDSTMLDFLLVKNKNKHVSAADNANTISSSALTDHSTIVQDRQFRIKGLKATPGGNLNPTKMNVHSVAAAAVTPTLNTFIPPNVHTIQNDSHISFNPIKPSETGLDNASGAPSSALSSRVALSRMTAFIAIFIAALVALY
ncbi:hypothetical protein BG011_001165 [Mortierella polycephala]|uniref:Uncharacterized protein n=1 Tax=Mortierella polycephala TaxID=41804 RepID=A0A9P6U632_9FUNG|nr:hypothetical protein BG011_001165 [Mortierella polycephala]